MRDEQEEDGRSLEVWRKEEKEEDIKIKFDESVSGCTLQSAIYLGVITGPPCSRVDLKKRRKENL